MPRLYVDEETEQAFVRIVRWYLEVEDVVRVVEADERGQLRVEGLLWKGRLEALVRAVRTNDETGLLEEPDAVAERYAARMMNLLGDRARYEHMARAARRRAEARLNWSVAGADVLARVERLRAIATPT